MTTQKTTLAVALIVKNEARMLTACLDSVKDIANEIIILDSGSSDDTEAIARRYTDKFYVNTEWPGFGRQRQLAQQYVTADWVLWIDADEQLTPELAASIREVLANPPENTIFEVARLSWAFGQFIHHSGWYPGYVERFYPTALTRFDDALVHENVIIPAGTKVKPLKGDMLHYTYNNLHEYLVKSANYAEAWAEQRFRKGKKNSLASVMMHSIGRFFRTYFIKRGFLDGKAGLLLAVLSVQSVFNKHAILWLKNREKQKEDTP